MLWWPLLSSMFTLSTPLSTINWCTMGILLNNHWMVLAGKSAHASWTVVEMACMSRCLFRCQRSIADCRLIQMPKSRTFKQAGWNFIIVLCILLLLILFYVLKLYQEWDWWGLVMGSKAFIGGFGLQWWLAWCQA
jgi:hypothetical protein